jgi:hypothetical protein
VARFAHGSAATDGYYRLGPLALTAANLDAGQPCSDRRVVPPELFVRLLATIEHAFGGKDQQRILKSADSDTGLTDC